MITVEKDKKEELELERRGQIIIDLLGLKVSKDRITTTYGDKTKKGLYLTVKRVMDEMLIN